MTETAGFEMKEIRENTAYEFISNQTANTCQKYGVKSVSLGAQKREDKK